MDSKLASFPTSLAVFVALWIAISGCEKVDVKQRNLKPVDPKIIEQYLVHGEPKPQKLLKVNLGNEIEIIGYDIVPREPVKGKFFTITLYYRVLKEPSKDWIFFGHLEPVSGQPYRVGLDHKPLHGRYPVIQWKPGQILKDVHRVRLPYDFPGNKGELWIGFYIENPSKPDWENRLKPVNPKVADDKYRVRAGIIKLKEGKPIEHKTYTVYKVKKGAIKLDGKLDEPAWQFAPSTGFFTNNMATTSKVIPATEAKLLWDDENLYVAFICRDRDIFTTYTKNDDPLYKQEAVEVMIDADNNLREYFELQVAPNGLIFDKFFHGGPRQGEDLKWSSGMKAAVQVSGTLNKRDDTDSGWTVEIAIPFKKVFKDGKGAPNLPPKPGDKWRANLFRVDHSGKNNRGSYSMWQPVYSNDFHTLKNWGFLVFSDTHVEKLPELKLKAKKDSKPAEPKGKATPKPKQANPKK